MSSDSQVSNLNEKEGKDEIYFFDLSYISWNYRTNGFIRVLYGLFLSKDRFCDVLISLYLPGVLIGYLETS